jgi:3-dehydroquinate synthase
MPETVRVSLAERGYDIVVGERLLQVAGQHIAPLLKTPRVFIVTDETVARFYLHRVTGALADAGIRATPIILPPGEQTKSFDHFTELAGTLLEHKPDRHTTLLALGGGVIGDLTGFAASVILRGIPFIQLPTTLLAQVDSSVGGKTAINAAHGKNLIGSFHQPKLVLADVSTLTTLPPREWRAGYAEVAKYGLINDAPFFAWLETNASSLREGNAALLSQAILHSCKAKAAIVAADEREQDDARALLNLGHTFGHALEAETGYGPELLHGEAVSIGMALAFRFSAALGLCTPAAAQRVETHLAAMGLPVTPRDIRPHWDTDALMEHFTRDKKAEGGTLTFILARGIGQAFVARQVDAGALRNFLHTFTG